MVGVVRRGGKRPWYSCTSHSPCNDRPTTERKNMASTFSMRKESAWDKAREHNSFWKVLDTNHTWETHYLHRMLAVCWESCVHFISQQGVEMSRIEGILFTLASAPTVIRLKGDDLRMEWYEDSEQIRNTANIAILDSMVLDSVTKYKLQKWKSTENLVGTWRLRDHLEDRIT